MRAATVPTVAAVAASILIALDPRGGNPQMTVQVVVTGTNVSTVQVTADDIYASGYVAASGNWFSIPVAALVGLTASQIANLTGLWTAIRVNVTAWTNGGVTLRVLVAVNPGG